MLALLRILSSPVAIITVCAFAFQLGHILGSRDGIALERAAALQRSIDLIQERNRTNAEINALGRDGLCRELGGVWLPDESRCD